MKFHAKHVKVLVALLKEFMDHVIIRFQRQYMEISGVDSERVVFIQATSQALEVELETLAVGAPLLDIYKFVRSCSETETIQLGVEHEKILTGTLINDERKTWYRFPYTFVPMDIVTLTFPENKTTLSIPTRLIRKALKEIVHSQLFLMLQLEPSKGLTMCTWTKHGSGGGKTTFSNTLTSHVYHQVFLSKYIVKFARMVTGSEMVFQFPIKPDQPLVIRSTVAETTTLQMAICPYTEE